MRDAVQNLLLRTKESGETEACTGLKTCSSVFFEEWLRFLEERGRLWPHAASVTPHRPRAQLRPLFRVPVVHPPPSPGAAPGCPVRATTVCALIQANPPAHHRPNPPHPQSLPVVPPACHSTVTRAVPHRQLCWCCVPPVQGICGGCSLPVNFGRAALSSGCP